MKKLLALLIALSLPLNSMAAECSTPVKLLEEGSVAPCRGYLFSPEAELKSRVSVKENVLLKEEVTVLNTMVDTLNKRNSESDKILDLERQKSDLWRTRAEDITLKYTSVEDGRGTRDFMFVLLGIGLTVLAGWSIGQAAGR